MAAKTSTPKLDAEIGSLYALPLAEFTPARNALAARLRKEGDRDASERVKGLAKPPASAWAVNVLFRDEKETMEALLAAGGRARRALGEALAHGTAESLRSSLKDERELRDDLRRRAVSLLTKEGSTPSRAIADRITVNLEALALSPAAAEAAERGWLDRDLDPPGFEVLAGLQLGARRERPEHRGLRLVPAPRERPRHEKKPESRKAAVPTKQRQHEEAAREREEKAERERREREQAKARERIARAEEKVAKIAAEAESLSREADRAEKDAAAAERAAVEARRSAETARKAADRAQERLNRAEADLEGLQ